MIWIRGYFSHRDCLNKGRFCTVYFYCILLYYDASSKYLVNDQKINWMVLSWRTYFWNLKVMTMTSVSQKFVVVETELSEWNIFFFDDICTLSSKSTKIFRESRADLSRILDGYSFKRGGAGWLLFLLLVGENGWLLVTG